MNRGTNARRHSVPDGGQTRQRQRGLGIIEVLIALVVVSFGVLGMASLQLTGMKHSSGGFNRSRALLYAENMATRMRINTPAVEALAYNNFDSADIACDVPPAPYCQARPGTLAEACNGAQLATFDLYSVACGDMGTKASGSGVLGELNGGRLQVDCVGDPCTVTSTYSITVSWNEGRVASDNADDIDSRRVQMRLKP